MSEAVKQLQLIDFKRFNRLIAALQQSVDYVRSYHDVMQSVKNKSPLAGTDIVNFMNRKGKLKETIATQAHLPKPPDSDKPNNPNTPAGRPGTPRRWLRPNASVEGSKAKIAALFKEKGVKKSDSGGLEYKGSKIYVPYDDFIFDLTHDLKKTALSLTERETRMGLKTLKKLGMPTSHIRSIRLQNAYTAMRQAGSSSSSESVVTIPQPSQIPIRSTPYNTPHSRQPSRSLPQIVQRRDRGGGAMQIV